MSGFTKGLELSLVERLREAATKYARHDTPPFMGYASPIERELLREAADALAHLTSVREHEAAVRGELCEALRPFARLGENDVLTAIAHVAAPFSFIQFTDNNGSKLHKLDFADLHRARAALAKAAPETGEAE